MQEQKKLFLQSQTLRVLFYNDAGISWDSLEPIVLALKDQPNVEIIILAMPTRHNNLAFTDMGAMQTLQTCAEKLNIPITQTLSANKIQCIKGFNENFEPLFVPQDFNAHYCFMTRPYSSLRPAGWENHDIAKVSKLCYREYGIYMFSTNRELYAYNPRELRYFDLIFAPTPFHKKFLESTLQTLTSFSKVISVGDTKLEMIKNEFKSNTQINHDKLHILYMPRWYDEEECSFLQYIDYFLEQMEAGTFHFIFRPHPLMQKSFIYDSQTLTSKDWETLKNRITKSPNGTWDEDPSLKPSFKQADLIISDTSSMLVFGFISGKPTIFTQSDFTEVNNWAIRWLQGCFIANNHTKLTKLLQDFRNDYHGTFAPKAKLYQDIIDNDFYFHENGSANAIAQTILQDFDDTLKQQKLISNSTYSTAST